MKNYRTLKDANPHDKRVLVRVDFNVPSDGSGQITDDTRIQAALPTINYLQQCKARTILISHYGRPNGQPQRSASLKKIVPRLSELLGCDVAFASSCVGTQAENAVSSLHAGDVLLLENTRFHKGEETKPNGHKGYDPTFAKRLAQLGDLFVHDAFSVSHRAQGSTTGIAEHLPTYAGLAMEHELTQIGQVFDAPTPPIMGIVGGAKVSTKIDLLSNLVKKLDTLAIGGGMANTFLAAQGYDVGASLCEHDLKDLALNILDSAQREKRTNLLPTHVVVAKEFKAHAQNRICDIGNVKPNELILDAGPQSVTHIQKAIDKSKTLIWNGPLGAFELTPFDKATVKAAQYTVGRVQNFELMAVAGGGDTVAALKHAGVDRGFTFVSTAGGAFLEWLEGKNLPGIDILKL